MRDRKVIMEFCRLKLLTFTQVKELTRDSLPSSSKIIKAVRLITLGQEYGNKLNSLSLDTNTHRVP